MNNTKTVFLSTSAIVNMASDGFRGETTSGEQMKNMVCLFFSFVPIFVLGLALIPVVIVNGVGPLFLSKLTLYIILLT